MVYRCFFNSVLKVLISLVHRIAEGRSFHRVGAALTRDLPQYSSLVSGIVNFPSAADLRSLVG